MTINISPTIRLELITEKDAEPIFNLVDKNRLHLRPWLPFVDKMQTVEFAENFVKGTMQRNKEGLEYAFAIFLENQLVGRIGVFNINLQNKIGEIGYWLAQNVQGKGIITQSCQALINFCFANLQLNRIEIKCGTQNLKSNIIPQKLNFTHEGVLRQAEWLYGNFIDLNLYSLLKSEHC